MSRFSPGLIHGHFPGVASASGEQLTSCPEDKSASPGVQGGEHPVSSDLAVTSGALNIEHVKVAPRPPGNANVSQAGGAWCSHSALWPGVCRGPPCASRALGRGGCGFPNVNFPNVSSALHERCSGNGVSEGKGFLWELLSGSSPAAHFPAAGGEFAVACGAGGSYGPGLPHQGSREAGSRGGAAHSCPDTCLVRLCLAGPGARRCPTWLKWAEVSGVVFQLGPGFSGLGKKGRRSKAGAGTEQVTCLKAQPHLPARGRTLRTRDATHRRGPR